MSKESDDYTLDKLRKATAGWPDECEGAIMHGWMREHDALTARAEKAEAALVKINEIRNSIIGLQSINWSEHIYPLVAALNAAGVEGMDYDDARGRFGTMLERTNAAEDQRDALAAVLRDALRAFRCTNNPEIYPDDHWSNRAVRLLPESLAGRQLDQEGGAS